MTGVTRRGADASRRRRQFPHHTLRPLFHPFLSPSTHPIRATMHTGEYDYLFKLLLIGDSGVGKVRTPTTCNHHLPLVAFINDTR